MLVAVRSRSCATALSAMHTRAQRSIQPIAPRIGAQIPHSAAAAAVAVSTPLRASPFATAAKSSAVVFDRAAKLAQRRRAALAPNHAFYGYLRDEVASRLVDRLADINKAFPVAVEIGCGSNAHVSRLLQTITTPQSHAASDALAAAAAAAAPAAAAAAGVSAEAAAAAAADPPLISAPTVSVPSRGAIRTLHLCDACPEALQRTRDYWSANESSIPSGREHVYHVLDEEGSLPFAPASVDLIVSSLNMHWINDLPGFLKRCRQALKPDGVFLAAMLGGATLQELRSALTVADMERLGGIHAHVSPFAYGRDCGDLMASAGFTMPTVDTDVLTMRYPDMFTLMEHLQGMGESNAALLRPKAVSRDVFVAGAAAYESLYADDDGLLPATFQILYMIGWAPHLSQPKPLQRGTATTKLGELNNKIGQQGKQEQEETAAPFKE